MKIKVIVLGKSPQRYVNEGCELYMERLRHYTKMEWIELPDRRRNTDPRTAIREQSRSISAILSPEEVLVLLDEGGTQYHSRGLADFIQKQANAGTRTLAFVIGGAYGFAEELKERARFVVSLSALTFPHDLVRIILLEQLYRAHTILRGEAYHHD